MFYQITKLSCYQITVAIQPQFWIDNNEFIVDALATGNSNLTGYIKNKYCDLLSYFVVSAIC